MTDPLFCKDCKLHPAMEIQTDGICKKIEEKEKIANIKFEMIQGSIKIAKEELDRRLESMNEIRRQLDTQAKTFVTKIETDLRFKEIELKISNLATLLSESKGGKKWEDHIITVLIGAAVVIVVWLMQHGIK